MDNCRSCDAKLSPDIDWCPQCYARIGPAAAPSRAPAPSLAPQPVIASVTVATAVPVTSSPDAQPLSPNELPADMLMEQLRAAHSNPRAKGSNLSTAGRAMVSAGVLVLCLLGYFLVISLIGASPSWRTFELYTPALLTVGGALLWVVWRSVLVDAPGR